MALENILARVARVATKIARQATRVDVVYRRGTASLPIEDVGLGESRFEELTDGDLILRLRPKDFLIEKQSLVLGGAQTTPREGDLIEVTDGGEVVTFELAAIGGEPAWRYTDRFETAFRCHTKEYDRRAA